MRWGTARTFSAVLALMVWQGGFTFYAAAVVPTGQRVLGSHLAQGLVTQQVTSILNVVGVFALVAMAPEAWSRDVPFRRARRSLWIAIALMLGMLFALHQTMDDVLGMDPRVGFDRALFHSWHRVYLWISTAQWGCALAFLALVLRRGTTPSAAPPLGSHPSTRGSTAPKGRAR
jgi:hypothetical protein